MGIASRKIGESVEVRYTIYKSNGTARDLTDAEVLEVKATLYLKKRERAVPCLEFSSLEKDDTINLSMLLGSAGVVDLVIDPTESKSLEEGEYFVEFAIELDKPNDPLYPSGKDVEYYQNDVVPLNLTA